MWQAVARLFKSILKQESPLKIDRRQYKSHRFMANRVASNDEPIRTLGQAIEQMGALVVSNMVPH
ncbi:hypothetical protein GCM10023156_59210 [Novipirellula rosea]|uniref:Uncharacterized protein n=1 Tax=Novipirellula rosea TaxID=1031540 RepID=A0ABP8NNA0_9BACT